MPHVVRMDEKRAKLCHLGVGLPTPDLWASAIETQWTRVLETREALTQLPPYGAPTPEETQLEGRLDVHMHDPRARSTTRNPRTISTFSCDIARPVSLSYLGLCHWRARN